MAELSVQLRDIEVAVADAGSSAGISRRFRRREIPYAEAVRLDAVLDAAYPRRPFADASCEIARRDHDCRCAIGNGRDVGIAKRMMRDRLREHFVRSHIAFAHSIRVLQPVALRARRHLGPGAAAEPGGRPGG